MLNRINGLALCILAFALGAAAQTAVTNNNDGSNGTIPVYTGSATLGNSPISVLGGNLGIGFGNPAYKVDIWNVGVGPALRVLGEAEATETDTAIDLGLVNGIPASYGRIGIQAINGNTGIETGDMWFGTVNNGVLLEKMRVTSSGNVGIGTASPRSLLDVGTSGGTNQGIRQGPYLEINSLAGYNNAAYLSINAVQNGTGTFVPVYSGASWAGGMVMTQSTGGYGSIDFKSYVWNNNPSPVSLANFTEVMHLDQGGNVGIGTTAPAFKMDVQGGQINASGGLSINGSPVINSTGAWVGPSSGLVGPQGPAGVAGAAGATGAQGPAGATGPAGASPWGLSGLNTYYTQGNVGIGTTTPGSTAAAVPVQTATGSVTIPAGTAYNLDTNGLIHSSTGYVFPDGSIQAIAFNPANCGADYAESVEVSGERTNYEPGDILVIDGHAPGKFLKSNQAYSTLVAGIYSTKPGFVGRLQPEDAKSKAEEVPMAIVGRVPAKVTAENGPIQVGDLLVSSSRMGYAMKGTDRSQMLGAVIGKALGSLDSGSGVIMVLVTLQ
jgi:hypothetical protein